MTRPLFTIRYGVPEVHRRPAATLYHEAFRRKLTPIVGADERAVNLLTEGLNLAHGIAALSDEQLVGVAGVHHRTEHFANVSPSALIRTFGWWSALKRILFGTLLERSVAEGELLMDGIAVDSAWRGKGVGTALLHAVIAFAREHEYRTVRLEVVDTNPSAKRLYERVGFMAMQTQQTGWLTRRLGFEAVTTMFKIV